MWVSISIFVMRWASQVDAKDKETACQCRRQKRPGFNRWVRKIVWRRKWQSTPVLLPGKSHGQRRLVGYSSWGHKDSDTTERLKNECLSCWEWEESEEKHKRGKYFPPHLSCLNRKISVCWLQWCLHNLLEKLAGRKLSTVSSSLNQGIYSKLFAFIWIVHFYVDH